MLTANKTSVIIGQSYSTKQGDTLTVLSTSDKKRYIWITFLHANTPPTYKQLARQDHVLSGNVKNPYYPSIFGNGFIGDTKIKLSSSSAYKAWVRMMERCYRQDLKIKYPSYTNVKCIEEWNNFSNFLVWFTENAVPNYELDKDILVKRNKLYSPDTCVFVPPDLNKLLTKADARRGDCPIGVNYHKVVGKFAASVRKNNKLQHIGYFDSPVNAFNAYKQHKERIISEYANEFFKSNRITQKVYNALLNYKVAIDD